MKHLEAIVSIERRFSRSARLDADLGGTPPLVGYVLQASPQKALETLARGQAETKQGAFTWTGPYGGGKSSAALLVGNLVGGAPRNRQIAQGIAGKELTALYKVAFPEGKKPWTVVPVTGSRVALRDAIALAAGTTLGWSTRAAVRASRSDAALCDALVTSARERSGLLLILDELGKFLEHAAMDHGDIHLLQDLAEKASRSQGRLVVIGILHQAFEHYGARNAREGRLEWTKVQGRFQDISFLAGVDETVALLGRAIQCELPGLAAHDRAQSIAVAIGQSRPTDTKSLAGALASCWPLNPISAILLGPLSRQRFAQNERSVFGFLASAEPFGFCDFLRQTPIDGTPSYNPDRLWDYLTANFAMALASGPDGSRFSLALEAIDRAAAMGTELHVRLTKAAAMIEAFRNGSGVYVGKPFLEASVPDASHKAVSAAITDLVKWAVLIDQPRRGGYAMFAGSDFELATAMERARSALSSDALARLPAAVGIPFVAAKRHYFKTGTLRAFDLALHLGMKGEDITAVADALAKRKRQGSGLMVAVLPGEHQAAATLEKSAEPLAVALERLGVVAAVSAWPSSARLLEEASDYFALDRVGKEHPRIEGDRIARRELDARKAACLKVIRDEFENGLSGATWILGPGNAGVVTGEPSLVASAIADAAFEQAPIIRSELVQRDRPSSNAMAAVRELVHAMVTRAGEASLGIVGYPAERGLYITLLSALGLHGEISPGTFGFKNPSKSPEGRSIQPAWDVLSERKEVSLRDVFQTWASPPYGIKLGVMPIVALANMLARRDHLAVYLDGVFQVELDLVFADRFLQDPGAVRLLETRRTIKQTAFLSALAAGLDLPSRSSSLAVAQEIFRRVRLIPAYSQRTAQLPEIVRAVRDKVLRANDPEQLLGIDLQSLKSDRPAATEVLAALAALEAAYPTMISEVRAALAEAIGVDGAFKGAATRARTLIGASSDLRFAAFAGRVGSMDGADGDVEGLASMLVHKPPKTWTDADVKEARLEIARFGRQFRETEALTSVRSRKNSTQAMALVVGLDAKTPPLLRSFEVTGAELEVAEEISRKIVALVSAGSRRDNIRLAALGRAVASLAEESTNL